MDGNIKMFNYSVYYPYLKLSYFHTDSFKAENFVYVSVRACACYLTTN